MAYTYDKQLWKDYPDTSTPITAERLNHMEDGISEAAKNGGGNYVVDSLDGNSTTNSPSVRAVNEGLGNIRGQILWTNPNPSSSFTSQNITLSDDNYDTLEIFFDNLKGNNQLSSSKIIKGKGGIITSFYRDGAKIDTATRVVTYINDTTYKIDGGILSQTGGTSSFSSDNQCIPLYIVGYKTWLFG